MRRLAAGALAAGLCAAALWPTLDAHRAGRRAAARLDALAARPPTGDCLGLEQALSLRVERLGPLLAGWQTVGGCGAGGGASVGTGVKWIGRGTTGGLFNVVQQGNYVRLTGNAQNPVSPGYQYIATSLISTDLSDKWTLGLSIPILYKYFYEVRDGYGMSNGGLGDMSALLTRKLGRINDTSLTVIVGTPTGKYRSTFFNAPLQPDQQLGFGRFTGTVMLDHTIDKSWGLMVLGAAGGYRGGRNSMHNYRAPGGSIYGYAGWFLGPLVPALGVTATGYMRQDTTGDFGATINAPVAQVAGNASLEWSNDYVAVLVGAQVPYAVRGRNWNEGPYIFGWLPWTVAVGLSVSPF